MAQLSDSQAFHLSRPAEWRLPLIISTPHVGTELPPEVEAQLKPMLARALPDTDWFVHELYDFAPALGVPLIRARYSRYVIDLNRPTSGPSLYQDQRRQTDVIPRTSFDGEDLYPAGFVLSEEERQRRITHYYQPYYDQLAQLIDEALQKFGKVLLWDGHSIKRSVPSIAQDPFVDLMLGDRDGSSADPRIIEAAWSSLQNSSFSSAHNAPFKGGQITRHHGQLRPGVYAMQLEKSQDIYMSDGRMDMSKKSRLQPVLRQALEAALKVMETL